MSQLFIKQELFKTLPAIDALIFDVDGVLLDVSRSFREAVCETVQDYAVRVLGLENTGPVLEPADTELFKFAGGFNGDWDLTNAAVALIVAKWTRGNSHDTLALRAEEPSWADYTGHIKRAGGGLQKAEAHVLELLTPSERREFARNWNPRGVTRTFQEFYGGDDACRSLYGFDPETMHGEGYYKREETLIDVSLLPKGLKLGLLTGRTLTETRLAVRHAGLGQLIPEKNWVTSDDRCKKPDGATLALAREKMDFSNAVYMGDTMDDLKTVHNYRELRSAGKARVAAAIALSGPSGATHRMAFLEGGAEIVTPDVNTFLQYLGAARRAGK